MRVDGAGDSSVVHNPVAESIVARLVAALRALDHDDPKTGWGGYLDGDVPRWDRLVVGGLSQGAGMAAYIAKHHACDRVVLFSSPWDFTGPRSAAGAVAVGAVRDARGALVCRVPREGSHGRLIRQAYAALQIPAGPCSSLRPRPDARRGEVAEPVPRQHDPRRPLSSTTGASCSARRLGPTVDAACAAPPPPEQPRGSRRPTGRPFRRRRVRVAARRRRVSPPCRGRGPRPRRHGDRCTLTGGVRARPHSRRDQLPGADRRRTSHRRDALQAARCVRGATRRRRHGRREPRAPSRDHVRRQARVAGSRSSTAGAAGCAAARWCSGCGSSAGTRASSAAATSVTGGT